MCFLLFLYVYPVLSSRRILLRSFSTSDGGKNFSGAKRCSGDSGTRSKNYDDAISSSQRVPSKKKQKTVDPVTVLLLYIYSLREARACNRTNWLSLHNDQNMFPCRADLVIRYFKIRRRACSDVVILNRPSVRPSVVIIYAFICFNSNRPDQITSKWLPFTVFSSFNICITIYSYNDTINIR